MKIRYLPQLLFLRLNSVSVNLTSSKIWQVLKKVNIALSDLEFPSLHLSLFFFFGYGSFVLECSVLVLKLISSLFQYLTKSQNL